MTSNDINMVLPFMKVRGKGSMALLSQEIDFHFLGDVVDRPELDAGVDELVGFTIPIKITGTLAAPDVGVDMGGLVAELAKRKLLDKLGLGGESDSTDPDAAAESPEEALEEKEEEIKDELEDKLKDKLKDIFGGG
ncbi:MAG: hypothetical protein OER80_14735, partial [Gammaproteobacteria bacterium]|nr:hypothetical protein [Gammaproteobacteria bacterium]